MTPWVGPPLDGDILGIGFLEHVPIGTSLGVTWHCDFCVLEAVLGHERTGDSTSGLCFHLNVHFLHHVQTLFISTAINSSAK